MAIMYPATLDDSNNSERIVFDRLRDNLSDEWTVYYGVSMIGQRKNNQGSQMHEIDFILVHRAHGVFVLEVKGGRIWLEDGQWRQGSSHHRDGVIPNMIETIRDRQGLVRDVLQWAPLDRHISFGFVFPNTNWIQPQADIGINRAQIIDASILNEDVESMLVALRHSMHGPMYAGLSDGDMQSVKQAFRPTVITTEALWQHIQAVEQQIVTLTEHQMRAMAWLRMPTVTQVAIHGCAGSGKTLIAVERAAELASQGKRVLLTCFNSALAKMLIAHPKLRRLQQQIVVNNIHAVARDMYRNQRMDIPAGVRVMDHIADLCLDEPNKYDVVIIDEAQDFKADWLEALRFVLKDPDKGYLYLFLDSNQNIYRQDLDALLRRLDVNPFPLQQNMRNTQQIAQVIRQTLPNAHEIIFAGPSGQEVIEREYQNADEMIRLLASDIAQLSRSGVPTNQMVILTPKSKLRSHLNAVDVLADLNIVDEVIDEDNDILFTSVYKYKGLESPIVFLVDIDTRRSQIDLDDAGGESIRSNDDYQKFVRYVGASRARTVLYLYREQ